MVHRILKQARKIRIDERYAPGPYKKLRKLVLPGDKKVITRIIKQERKHYQKVNGMIKKYEKLGVKIKKRGLPDID